MKLVQKIELYGQEIKKNLRSYIEISFGQIVYSSTELVALNLDSHTSLVNIISLQHREILNLLISAKIHLSHRNQKFR